MKDLPGEIWLDEEKGIVFMIQTEAATTELLLSALSHVNTLIQKSNRKLLLVDISNPSAGIPSEARKAAAKVMEEMVLEKQAFVVTNPISRMLAKTMSKLGKQTHPMQFFGKREEAIAWLEEE